VFHDVKIVRMYFQALDCRKNYRRYLRVVCLDLIQADLAVLVDPERLALLEQPVSPDRRAPLANRADKDQLDHPGRQELQDFKVRIVFPQKT